MAFKNGIEKYDQVQNVVYRAGETQIKLLLIFRWRYLCYLSSRNNYYELLESLWVVINLK